MPAVPAIQVVSTALCLVLGLTGAWLQWRLKEDSASVLVFIAAYPVGGWLSFQAAWRQLRQGQLSVDLLMIVAAAGAALIGDWLEGTVLLFLFSLSGTLEAYATYRTGRSIESLIQLRPREAWLVGESQGPPRRVGIDQLRIGDLVRVRPGEGLPVDGMVVEGESWVNEATLTGESQAVHKRVGDLVFAGTMNQQGAMVVRMERPNDQSAIARIVDMVEQAQAQKTATQHLVESWQRPYVLGVLAGSAAVFFGSHFLWKDSWPIAFYRSMVLLVSASPCAVVVSSPAVMLSAIARAGRGGILFKGANHLEKLGNVDVIAFDKTGTLTLGKPEVTEVWCNNAEQLGFFLKLAAEIESSSEHPLAAPILREAQRRGILFDPSRVTGFQSQTGMGVEGEVQGIWIGIGREELFTSRSLRIPTDLQSLVDRWRYEGKTVLIILTSCTDLYGAIAVEDQVRPSAAKIVGAIRRLGVRSVVVLTGDHQRVGMAVATQVQANHVFSELLPEGKVIEIRKLKDQGMVAMVGDGVNDAPALASADIGIAMGGAGTDVALETADVVLMRDDLGRLPLAIWIGRTAKRRVDQNMVFAFSMIGLLILSTFFDLPLWMGVLGHEGSTVLVIMNGLRFLWERLPSFE
jgi:Cd2+/Zn2+-exporting ATPase